jgi:hypothetical protein
LNNDFCVGHLFFPKPGAVAQRLARLPVPELAQPLLELQLVSGNAFRFDMMAQRMRFFGTPVSWSTGGGYGCSGDKRDISTPHLWSAATWAKWIALFKERQAYGPKHVRYLTVLPGQIKSGQRDEQAQSW